MNTVYLDSAATTSLDERVLDQMLPFLRGVYGNPSSIHSAGRSARLAIEESRKKVATLLGGKPAEFFFTSCGTESTNTVFQAVLRSLNCKHIITSPIEHHATLRTAEHLAKEFGAELHFCKHDQHGEIDYEHLATLVKKCSQKGKTFMSIMHANNESGVINDIERIGNISKEHGVLFHSDMVQTIGHVDIRFDEIPVDFASASAHKFHGPKGKGLLYISGDVKLEPLLLGGGQERNMRAGTEDVPGIVGFASALEFAIEEKEKENEHCGHLKEYCWNLLQDTFGEDVRLTSTAPNTLPRVLSVLFPQNEKTEMLQMALDIKGIAVSGGSACSSGAVGGSHVINVLEETPCVPLRISFCKWNTEADVDAFLKAMKEILL